MGRNGIHNISGIRKTNPLVIKNLQTRGFHLYNRYFRPSLQLTTIIETRDLESLQIADIIFPLVVLMREYRMR